MRKITAVVPARNCRRQLGPCLQALYRSEYVPEIIVVDDGSDDGTEEMVRRHWPDVTFFSIPAHTGYAHAANAGLRLVRTEYAFVIRPDLQPGRSCIGRLLAAMKEERVFCAVPAFCGPFSTAFCGPFSAAASGRKKGSGPSQGPSGAKVRGAALPGALHPASRTAEIIEIIAVPDGCAMYRMQALEEFGWFDERHFDGLEAFDLSLRGALHGYRTVRAAGALVRRGSRTDKEKITEEKEGKEKKEGKERKEVSSCVSGPDTFRRQLAAGNGHYVFYKNLPWLLRLPASAVGTAAQIASFASSGEPDAWRMAAVRGRALCSLEKERRLALDDGVGIWPENLSDAAFLGMEEAACRIYPLYLAEKEPASADRIPRWLHIHRLLMQELGQVTDLLCCRPCYYMPVHVRARCRCGRHLCGESSE